MKKVVLLGILLLVLVFAAATQLMAVGTWTPQNSGTDAYLFSVDFVNDTTGWAVGMGGIILHTTDGGATWTKKTSGVISSLRAVDFVNVRPVVIPTDLGAQGQYNASAITNTAGWAVGDGGTILYSDDNGGTWTKQTSGTTNSLHSVFFINGATGWTVGSGGTILHTTDGGSIWKAQTPGTNPNLSLYSVHFVNATTGWAVGEGGLILKTTDGGSIWKAQTPGTNPNLAIYSVHFVNATTGWAVGTAGTILRTSDGGATWGLQTSGTTNPLLSVDFINATTGWAVGGNGTILHTTNAGATWTSQAIGATNGLWSAHFTSANTGWAVGDTGTILKYQDTTGGTTSTTQAGTTSTTVLGTTTTTNAPGTFRDVKSTDWFFTYVRDLALANILSGYPDGTFKPQNNITRAEFAKVIVLAHGSTPLTGAASSFSDVPSTYWAKDYIERAKELGFIGGYPDGTFKPANNISRQEIAKIVVLANGSLPATSYKATFSDVPQSLWSWPYVTKAADLGIIGGYPGGLFKPTNAATRAEASKMVKVMIDAAP